MFPAGEYDADTIRRIAMASHGMSVVEIKRDYENQWGVASGHRLQDPLQPPGHHEHPMRVTGPARPRLRTSADHPDARFWAPSTTVPAA